MLKNSGKYEDIINLPHHVSKKHPRMSLEARSAQFAPFAALNGYEELIKETARETNQRIEINEELKVILDEKIRLIKEKINTKPNITVTYFVPDIKKDGGKYITEECDIRRIDEYEHKVILKDKRKIIISDIIEITGNLFDKFENF